MNKHRFKGKSAYYRLLRAAECGYHRELLLSVNYNRNLVAVYKALKGRSTVECQKRHRQEILANVAEIKRLYQDFK